MRGAGRDLRFRCHAPPNIALNPHATVMSSSTSDRNRRFERRRSQQDRVIAGAGRSVYVMPVIGRWGALAP